MRVGKIQIMPSAAILAAAAFLCLLPAIANSAGGASNATVLSYGKTNAMAGHGNPSGSLRQDEFHPGTPMVLDPVTGALEFDLGGSETRKLQLQLAYPIVLETNQHLLPPVPGARLFGLDATLRIPLGNGLSLHGGAEQILGNTQFQSVGSIQCMNGVLGPDSYTASGCRFVTDDNSVFDRHTLNLGARHEFGNVSTSVNWFSTKREKGVSDVYRPNQVDLENQLLAPFTSASVLPGSVSTPYIANEASGIDLNFQVGFTTDQAGEIRLGLALTRVMDANYQGIYDGRGIGLLDWSTAKPFDSAALGLEWSRGSFSSGIRGYYREPVNFLNRENLDSLSTFDVHFTWRAPWNANLSVGASNVLGDDRNSIDKATDRYESIYGRIPYVRYQQDL
jgi:hypothetical protein